MFAIFLQAVGILALMFVAFLLFEAIRNDLMAERFSKSPIWQAIRDYKNNPENWNRTHVNYTNAIKHKSGMMYFKHWDVLNGVFVALSDPDNPAEIKMSIKQTKSLNFHNKEMQGKAALKLAKIAIEKSFEADKRAIETTRAEAKAIKKIETAGTF